MSTTTPNMGLVKPDVGASVDVWGTENNTSLDTVDVHDHSAGKGVKIPSSGIGINADLTFAGFALTNLKALDLTPIATATATYATSLFVDSSDNELYWRTNGGVNVKLTSGTSLNASLLGGFTGDYGSGGSTVSFTSGTSIYNFLRAANHRAFIDCSDIRLFQGTSGITAAVKLRSPNSLATSYDWVYPTALPGSQALVQLSSAGQVSASNTVPNAITFSAQPTFSAGAAAASGQHFTVSGAGLYKRGSRSRHQPAVLAVITNGTGVFAALTGLFQAGGATDELIFGIAVVEGERITSVSMLVDPAGATAITMNLRKRDGAGTSTIVGSASSSGTALQTVTISGLTETVTSAFVGYSVDINAGQAGDFIHGITDVTDVP